MRRARFGVRGVAQLGSASALGAEGRRFESCHPDQAGLIGTVGPVGCPVAEGDGFPWEAVALSAVWGCAVRLRPDFGADIEGRGRWALKIELGNN